MTSDDDFLRSQLGGPAVSGDANLALAALKPAMKRARGRRHAAVGVLAAAVIGVSGAGVVAVNSSRPAPILQTSSTPDESGRMPVSSEPSQGAANTDGLDGGADSGSSLGADESDVDEDRPVSTEAPVSPSSVASVPGPPPLTSPPDAQVSSGWPATTATPMDRSTQPAVTTTSTIAPATTTTSSIPAFGEEIISSSCGSITVSFRGDGVSLLSAGSGPA